MKKSLVVVLSVSLLVLAVSRISYSYFKGGGITNEEHLSVVAKKLAVIFTDNSELTGEIYPDYYESKTFSVENKSESLYKYDIIFEDLVNTFETSGFLQYRITSTDGGYSMKDFEDIPKSSTEQDTILAYSVPIEDGKKHNYTLEIRYQNSEIIDQSIDMGRVLSGNLAITEGTRDPKLKSVELVIPFGKTETYTKDIYEGEKAEFDISANEYYTLDEASVSCTNNQKARIESSKVIIDKVTDNTKCTVTLKRTYTVNVLVSGGSASPSSMTVTSGKDATSTLAVEDYHDIKKADVDCTKNQNGSIEDNILTISSVSDDTECSVTIPLNEYDVTLIVENGSTTTPTQKVSHGSSATFNVSTNEGYKTDGATLTCDNNYNQTLSGSVTSIEIPNIMSETNCTLKMKKMPRGLFYDTILADNSKIGTRSSFSTAFSTSGLYQETNTNFIETGTGQTKKVVYYFAGDGLQIDNWVVFGGFWWRIIRTNEDGSVRLLYAGTSSSTEQGYINNTTSKYNDSYNNTRYVGYMYGDAGDLTKNRENKTDSTIKGVIDSWYTTNMTKNDDQSHTYGSYLSRTAVYCNDRANPRYAAKSTMYYAAYKRLVDSKRPSFKCGNNEKGELYTGETGGADTADRFTASNKSNVGNQKLTYPVALMTADEVSYAGGVDGSKSENTYYYKNSNGGSVTGDTWWWTMSPYRAYSSGSADVFYVGGSNDPGYLYNSYVNYSYGVRPVVSLKSCVSVSGKGTTTDPYIPSIDSACALADN